MEGRRGCGGELGGGRFGEMWEKARCPLEEGDEQAMNSKSMEELFWREQIRWFGDEVQTDGYFFAGPGLPWKEIGSGFHHAGNDLV